MPRSAGARSPTISSPRATRFATISAGDERALMRRDGFARVIEQAGAERIDIVTPAPTNVQMGRETIGRLIDRGFRGAVFCSSDAMALGVVTEVLARGLTLPGDIAVVGFGDFDYAGHTSPQPPRCWSTGRRSPISPPMRSSLGSRADRCRPR